MSEMLKPMACCGTLYVSTFQLLLDHEYYIIYLIMTFLLVEVIVDPSPVSSDIDVLKQSNLLENAKELW